MTSDTTLRTADDVELAASWRVPRLESPTAVVLVHGFTGFKDAPETMLLAERLVDRGWSVLSYDSRGHGSSGGMCTLGEEERLDVDAAVDAASERADQVVAVGASMGGIAVVNHLAAGSDACGAVIVATPSQWRVPRSTRGLVAVAVTRTPLGRAVAARRLGTRVLARPRRGPPPVERIRSVRVPVAVLHGRDDRFLPPTAATALFHALPGRRRLEIVPRMGHGFDPAGIAPIEDAVSWVTRETIRYPA